MLGRAELFQKRPRRGGEKRGIVGSGGGAAVSAGREGEIGGGRLEKVKLTGGPGLSAGERERGRGSGRLAGPGPRRRGERARGGSRPKGRKKERGREGFAFFFFFK